MCTLVDQMLAWWEALSAATVVIEKVKPLTKAVFETKLRFKQLMKRAKAILPEAIELLQINRVFKNYIVFDPIGLGELKRALNKATKLKEQLSRSPSYLDCTHPFSCVVGVDINSQDFNQLVLSSSNFSQLFEASKAPPDFFNLKSIMPRPIAEFHDSFVEQFKSRQVINIIHQYQNYISLTPNRKSLGIKACVKMCLQEDHFYLVTFIRVVDYKQNLILNRLGEVDSFGETFASLTGVEHHFQVDNIVLPLFLFMPSLIPCFLEYFYELPDFWLPKFKMSWLQKCFFFVFKDQKRIVQRLSIELKKHRHSMRDYSNCLFDILSELRYQDVAEVFQLKLDFTEYQITKQSFQINLVELHLTDVKKVTKYANQNNFDACFSLVQKLRIDKESYETLQTMSNKSTGFPLDGDVKTKRSKLRNTKQENNGTSMESSAQGDIQSKCNKPTKGLTEELSSFPSLKETRRKSILQRNSSSLGLQYFNEHKRKSITSNVESDHSKLNSGVHSSETDDRELLFGCLVRLRKTMEQRNLSRLQTHWINLQRLFFLQKNCTFGQEHRRQIRWLTRTAA